MRHVVRYGMNTHVGEHVRVTMLWDDFGHTLLAEVAVGHLPAGVGHIEFDTSNGKFWLGVSVIDRFQGKGIGSLLVKEMCALAEINEVPTDVWLTCRPELVDFYGRAGFKVVDSEQPNVRFGDGQKLMCKLDARNIR